jgi:hypothetical protein
MRNNVLALVELLTILIELRLHQRKGIVTVG